MSCSVRKTTLILACAAALLVPASVEAATGGALRPAGCVADPSAPHGACAEGRFLADFYSEFALSPDGRQLYVAARSSHALTVFDRNAATGALTQKPGTAGCIVDSDLPSVPAGCATARGLRSPNSVVVSPDGHHVYVSSIGDDAIAMFARRADGSLQFLDCITSDNSVGGCFVGRRMDELSEITISPDGATVYGGGDGTPNVTGSIVAFRRNPATGILEQLGGAAGCIAGVNPGNGGCAADPPIVFPRELVVSPDGRRVYVAEGRASAVIAYQRNATTGALTPLDRSAGGCLAGSSVGGCAPYSILAGGNVENLALSPDGSRVYATLHFSGRLVTFARLANGGVAPISGACVQHTGNPDCPGSARGLSGIYAVAPVPGNLYVGADPGMLSLDLAGNGLPAAKASPFGCVHHGLAGCTAFPAIATVRDVAVSPDGRFVYGLGAGRLVWLARDRAPSCAPLSGTVEAGRSLPIRLSCSDPDGDAVAYEIVSPVAKGTLGPIGPDGAATYSGSSAGTDSFTYRARASSGVSDPATATISVTAPPGPPRGPGPTPRITSRVAHLWAAGTTRTRVLQLLVRDVPAGARIEVRCTGKRRDCRFKKITRTVRRATRRFNLLKAIPKRKRVFGRGAKVEVRVTAPGMIGRSVAFTIRRRKTPKITYGCVPAGSTRVRRTCA